ncbi:PH domain-containing protein [Salinibacterium sp. SWN1162]|uniref:PH domain-containing protein n=1 Tax=Salinibacterium sp. SWN1162 TaxID=2792053 RepID=UPI0018CD7911|nr:PH domain-containing protein [Salinibacterium sp. SWN1162]MBH0008329.1 PH domain-containing protein [Salinibacterium sp. SWN1162]
MTQRLDLPDAEWRGVSRKYAFVEVGGLLIVGVILSIAASIPAFVSGISWFAALPISLGIIFLINILLTPRRVRAIGYMLREDDLVFRRGLMFRRVVAVPYGRMQLVDINRGPLDRAVGLSELKFVTAAASTGVVIPGLPEQDAEELRDTLVALAESRRAGL